MNINKDTVIQQCADGYRTASGTSEPVKYGELGSKIAALSGGGASTDYALEFPAPIIMLTVTDAE